MATAANLSEMVSEQVLTGSIAYGTRPFAAARRRITPEAGHALEKLGHAIEYLADEFAFECRNRTESATAGKHPQVAAIEILMARNREIYFNCPTAPTLVERLRSLLRLQQA